MTRPATFIRRSHRLPLLLGPQSPPANRHSRLSDGQDDVGRAVPALRFAVSVHALHRIASLPPPTSLGPPQNPSVDAGRRLACLSMSREVRQLPCVRNRALQFDTVHFLN